MSAAARSSKARRALLLAKRLRAKHGLSVDLTVPCYDLVQPELYDGPPWAQLIAQLARYEAIVWRSLVLTLRRLAGHPGQTGNPGFGPRRR